MNLPEILRKYLEIKGWRASDLAKATGIPSSALSELLGPGGKRQSLGYEYLGAIAGKTDINPLYLLTGEGLEIRSDSPAAEFPRAQVVQATVIALSIAGGGGLAPAEEGRLIATIAELLARGQSEEQIRARLASQAVQSLAGLLRPE